MATGVTNTTTLNDLVGQIVSSEAQSAAYGARVMRNLIHAVEVPQGAGSIVVPRFKALTVAGLTQATAPSAFAWETDGVTLTPVERGVLVSISKSALYADPWSDLAPYGEQMGRALALDEDSMILGQASSISEVSLSGTCTLSGMLASIAYLEGQDAPGPYFAVFHPICWAALRDELADAGAFAQVGTRVVEGFGEGVTNLAGYVGAPFGVPCFISTKVENSSGHYHNIVAAKEALGYAWTYDLRVDVDDNIPARAFDVMGWYAGDTDILVDVYATRMIMAS